MKTPTQQPQHLTITITPTTRILTHQKQKLYIAISTDNATLDIVSASEDTNIVKWYTRIPIDQNITIETITIINDRLYILTNDKTRKPIYKISLKYGYFKRSW